MRLGDLDALKNEIDTWGCNDYDKYDFIEAIDDAPTVEAYTPEQVKELVDLNKKLSEKRPQGEYFIEELRKWLISQGFSEGTVEDKIDEFNKLIKNIRGEE